MNEFSEIQSQYQVGIYIQDCVNGGAESPERPYFLLEPEFAMNIVKTSCDLGGEEEEKRNKAVEMTKVLQCTMGLLHVPIQTPRKVIKPTRCFAGVSFLCVKINIRF